MVVGYLTTEYTRHEVEPKHSLASSERSKGRSRPPLADDMLEGAEAIARFLGKRWSERKVRHARDVGTLPIRKKRGMGLYAFKSELTAALWASDSLPARQEECEMGEMDGEDAGIVDERQAGCRALEDRHITERMDGVEDGENCLASTRFSTERRR